MKARTFPTMFVLLGVLWMAGGFLVAGCKSTPAVDWNSRVGTYTFDQAVTEMGPPDKTAKLSDGQTVAEWIKYSNNGGFSFGVGTGFYGSGGGAGAVGVSRTVDTGANAKVLRLVFGPDNRLLSWSKNY